MKSVDNAHHAIGDALTERIDLTRMVVTAWRDRDLSVLDSAIVRALGASNPELSVDDLIPTAIVGNVREIAQQQSRDRRDQVDTEDMTECEDEYIELIRIASDTRSEPFLQERRYHIRDAITLSIAARLNVIPLEDEWRKKPAQSARPIQSLSFVTEVANYFRDYKQQTGRMDIADLLASDFEPVDACYLCMLDRRGGMPPLAVQALRRMLPKAFFCYIIQP